MADTTTPLTRNRPESGARTPFQKWLALACFLALTLGGGTLIGLSTPPGEWYASLQKPFFNPPNWLFGPVWTVLYIMIGVAGWRTWMRGYKGLPMQVWFAQMVFNFMWSPAFFGMQNMGLALIIIGCMVALTVLFIILTAKADRTSALLMTPYLAWISFAGLLNATLWWMN